MTRSLLLFAGLVPAVLAVSLAPARGDQSKVAYVVAGTAAEQPAVVERARETATRTGAQLRVPITTADQLGVTHVLAAGGYDKVITIGVDRRIAIDPVAARYPETRFIEARSIPAP
jgi:hypothetical protein